jgi:hypothetical protein
VYRAVPRPRGGEGLGVRQGCSASQVVRGQASTGLRRVVKARRGRHVRGYFAFIVVRSFCASSRLCNLPGGEEGRGVYGAAPLCMERACVAM